MAMCSSGSLGIISCPQGGCSSIAMVVDGNISGSKSLSTLSVKAGKTAPHAMTEFYGFDGMICVDLYCLSSIGFDGSSNYVCKRHCLTYSKTRNSPECYCVSLLGDLCVSDQAVGSFARIDICCNGTRVFCKCIIPIMVCLVSGYSFVVDYNDVVVITTDACTVNTTCSGSAASRICLSNVTQICGTYRIGTTCIYNCTWTG